MKLWELLPEFYLLSPEVMNLQDAVGLQVERFLQARDEMLLQLDVSTATWGLRIWEEAYGLPTDVSRPDEYRRARILSKMRGQGATTPKMIQQVAESFSNGLVEVLEYPEEYRFEVKFVSIYGRPPNLDDLAAALEEIKPAHLAYTFVFLYRTYGELEEHTHLALEPYTHQQLREEEIA